MISKNEIKSLKAFLELNSSKAKITKVILIAVALGLIPVIVVGGTTIGNAVQLFQKRNKYKKYTKKQIYNAINGLKKQKMIEFISEKKGVTTLRITRKGESKIKSFSLDMLSIKKPYKWDGKWRVVMFDFPIKYKKVRNPLRFKIKQLGFIQLQKSVWVHPYPCVDEILFLVDYYKVRNFIEILTVEEILNDKKLKKAFDLI